MLLGIMEHVATLTEGNKIAQAVMGGIMITVSCGKRNPSGPDFLQEAGQSGCSRWVPPQYPPLPVAPC
jgi:hypothetical protein